MGVAGNRRKELNGKMKVKKIVLKEKKRGVVRGGADCWGRRLLGGEGGGRDQKGKGVLLSRLNLHGILFKSFINNASHQLKGTAKDFWLPI